MRILQINTIVNSGSTGRIAEDIGKVLMANGHESFIAYGRGDRPSQSKLIRIGNAFDVYWHGLQTLLFDRHGFASKKATQDFIKKVEEIKPDLIAFHNLHGYYIHLPTLFEFIKKSSIPVVWTLYDCWAFTGHCTYFDDIDCTKWVDHCHHCPKYKNYPSSWVDNSFFNFENKKRFFTSIEKMEIVVHSEWLNLLVQKSFLKKYKVHVIHSAINLDLFKYVESNLRNQYKLCHKRVILGCASPWSNRKGYNDFVELSKILSDEFQIVMIGLNPKEIKSLPNHIIGIQRTESIVELAQWYSLACVFINPTSQDNFPTTNIEALACGTPVITYNTGGSPEAVDQLTGRVVPKGDLDGIVNAIHEICSIDRDVWRKNCRARAEKHFDKNKQFLKYLQLYEEMIKNSSNKI